MEDRLVALLKSEGINPTRFAERIGVQRSSMSHILSGRNKPSYDFLVKILENFPSVNPDWLLLGKGYMYKDDYPAQPSLFDAVKTIADKEISLPGTVNPVAERKNKQFENDTDDLKAQAAANILVKNHERDKEIDRIVIFYKDKTFKEFQPDL